MKTYTVLIVLICTGISFAQKVYSVEYANQADVKVYVAAYKNQAEIKVCNGDRIIADCDEQIISIKLSL